MKMILSGIKTAASLVIISVPLIGCGPSADSRYDSGYSDGYASGYNTTCQIRATLSEGDWKDKNYNQGYYDGFESGAYDCKNKK